MAKNKWKFTISTKWLLRLKKWSRKSWRNGNQRFRFSLWWIHGLSFLKGQISTFVTLVMVWFTSQLITNSILKHNVIVWLLGLHLDFDKGSLRGPFIFFNKRRRNGVHSLSRFERCMLIFLIFLYYGSKTRF